MGRAIILVLDSVGIGGAPDAEHYGDAGADTVGHIAKACWAGTADRDRMRSGPLRLPNLVKMGLGRCCEIATGEVPPGLDGACAEGAIYGSACETSSGKDTPSGHWEIAGVPAHFAWGYFPDCVPCFPRELLDDLCARSGLSGTLGNCHASGTSIIAELGAEHLRTGRPICYTSADSVFQIAAHEERFGLDRLYDVCTVARELTNPLRIGRVIARPFVGTHPSSFRRSGNRRDFCVPPPAPTILDLATLAGQHVVTVGKIGDIFAGSGTGRVLKATSNSKLFDRTLEGLAFLGDGGLLVANFVDFDSEYGHRRDVAGYAAALEAFDARLPELLAILRSGDLLVVTADHGCDPTWPGTDHTREMVPFMAVRKGLMGGSIGRRATFADMGASVARHLGLPAPSAGTPFC
jgi:phosphopentomutase